MTELFVAIVSAAVGCIGTYIVSLLLRSRKIIEYATSSISLLRLNLLVENTISVSVKKSVLTGDQADDGETVPLKSVYGFQVKIINAGNEDIEKLDDIEICLDSAAKIVKCETEPVSTEGYKISIQKDAQKQNICHISIPYFNKHEQIITRLISTENEDSSCFVKAHGFGVKTRPERSTTRQNILSNTAMFSIIAAFIIFIYIIFNQSRDLKNILEIAAILLLMICLICMSLLSITSPRKSSFSKDWDWDLPIEKNKKKST